MIIEHSSSEATYFSQSLTEPRKNYFKPNSWMN